MDLFKFTNHYKHRYGRYITLVEDLSPMPERYAPDYCEELSAAFEEFLEGSDGELLLELEYGMDYDQSICNLRQRILGLPAPTPTK